jgi:hypothetical protein
MRRGSHARPHGQRTLGGAVLDHEFGGLWPNDFNKECLMKAYRKALFLGLCMATSAVTAPTIASAGVAIDINIAPPPVRVETVPPPRVGFVWAPGFWEYRGHEHVWVPGRWVGERRGYHWVPDRWEQRGPNWHHERGHWEH